MLSASGQGPVWPGTMDISRQQLPADLDQTIQRYVRQNQLGVSFSDRISSLYLPMAKWVADKHTNGQTLFIGINGAQGSGKSTLAGLLELILNNAFGKHAISVSIDDFYHERSTRQQLAHDLHPLFITRGVPGTHDLDLALSTFRQIQDNSEFPVLIPAFDKAIDDRLPRERWKSYEHPVDIVLFEGWCVGAHPQTEQELIMLAVPSMEQVYEWRGLQENKLQASTSHASPAGVMDQQALRRFIMHYERLTSHQLRHMPEYADVWLPLNQQHQIADVMIRQES